MKHAFAALVLAAGAALSWTACTLDAFCDRGAPGCVDPGCHDGAKTGDETDVDCGGSCAPCSVDQACAVGGDCGTGRCVSGRCCEAPCGLWASSFGSLGYDTVNSVAIAPDGSIYLVGSFSGIVDFGGGPLASAGASDIFVLKLDANGKHLWSERYGGPLDDGLESFALTPAGHLVIALTLPEDEIDLGGGALHGTTDQNLYLFELDADGHHVWSRAYAGEIDIAQIAVAPGGDLVLGASFYSADLGAAGKLSSAGSNDVLLARFTAAGEPIWAKRFGSVWGDIGERVAVGADGEIYLLVRYSRTWSFGGAALKNSNGEFSIGVAKFDGDGKYRWSRGWPNGSSHYGTGLVVDDRGAVWVSGEIQGSLDVGTGPLPAAVAGSALVAKLDADSGETEWAASYGEHTMAAHSIASDGQGGLLVSGVYKGNADFGGGVTLTAGTGQPFVAHLDAGGGALWARGVKGVGDYATLATNASGDLVVLAGGYRGTLDAGVGSLPSAGSTDAFVAGFLP